MIKNKKYLIYFIIFSGAILILGMLGSAPLWTQESRWGLICQQMLLRHEYFKTYLTGQLYLDKPLVSYWMVVGFAKLFGGLNNWALRLPSALSGLISILCVYKIGKIQSNKQTGLLAAALLITTYFFVFWSRIASADMLNVMGILLAVTYYVKNKTKTDFRNYFIFFLLCLFASLLKGLLAPCIIFLVCFIDIVLNNNLKNHINFKILPAIIISVILYFLFFSKNGLHEVYRENILRYFTPIDHKKPFYIYFYYLPIYLLPWTVFFIPALISRIKNLKKLNINTLWYLLSTMGILLFFMGSGSRRGYYLLPIIPFGILFTADWIIGHENKIKLLNYCKYIGLVFFSLLFCYFLIITPIIANPHPRKILAQEVHTQTNKIKPWSDWHIISVRSLKSSLYYLHTQRPIQAFWPPKLKSKIQNYIKKYPISILVTRVKFENKIKKILPNYKTIHQPKDWFQLHGLKPMDEAQAVVFIPRAFP